MKIFEPHAFGGQSGGSVFLVKRFLGAFGLVVCLAVSLTRSVSPDADRLNIYRSDFVSVSVGKYQLCLKTKDREAYCFSPLLVKGNRWNSGEPISLTPSGKDAKEVFYTGDHFCAIDTDDNLKCTGLNDRRQLGQGGTDSDFLSYISFPASPFPYGVSDFAGARDHLCAVVVGQARCWAGNSYAQSTGEVGSPPGDVYPEDSTAAALPEKADTVTASEGSSCARGLSGSVYCWGTNRRGELGVSADVGRHAPHPVVKVPLPRPAAKLFDRRTATSCAALDDASVYCWGGIRAPDGAYARPGPPGHRHRHQGHVGKDRPDRGRPARLRRDRPLQPSHRHRPGCARAPGRPRTRRRHLRPPPRHRLLGHRHRSRLLPQHRQTNRPNSTILKLHFPSCSATSSHTK